MTKNEKIQVNMEEITRKLLELKSQLDDYYYNVFIPEYRENVPIKNKSTKSDINENSGQDHPFFE